MHFFHLFSYNVHIRRCDMGRNTLPIIVIFFLLQGKSGVHMPQIPRIPRESLHELEALINNAQRMMDAMDRINSLPDLKKISEIVDNFSA